MPAAAAIPAAVGGAGLILGGIQNAKAQHSANAAQNAQASEIARQNAAYDQLKQILQEQSGAGGAFDPSAQLKQLGQDTAFQEGQGLSNAAGAFKTMGYLPGDTAATGALRAKSQQYNLAYADAANRIRSQTAMNKIGAYQGLLGGSTALNSAIGAYGQQQQIALGQQQNPGSFMQSMMPFLGNQPPSANFNMAGMGVANAAKKF